jgi:archaellin
VVVTVVVTVVVIVAVVTVAAVVAAVVAAITLLGKQWKKGRSRRGHGTQKRYIHVKSVWVWGVELAKTCKNIKTDRRTAKVYICFF